MAAAEVYGVLNGTTVQLEERPTLCPEGVRLRVRLEPSVSEMSPQEIADRAATYVFDHVGDAAAVGAPQRVEDRWRVPVLLSYRDRQLGILTYTLAGELVREESDAPRMMRERSRED